MSSTLFSSDNNHLFDLVQARLALTLDEHRRADVTQMIEELIAGGIVSDAKDLLATLSKEPTTDPLWQKIIRVATIGETYFFRDQSQLNALRYSVLPNLIAQRRLEGHLALRLWSAGCATGEEPYSLAILLRELLPDFKAWHISILATDVNINNLERARNGIYRAWSFRSETPEEVRHTWFVEDQGSYKIDSSIREMVMFAPLNLASDDYPSYANTTIEMDVILCRNVLIYFDSATSAAVVKRFHGALRQQAWLVLGHSESSCIGNEDFQPRDFENAMLYQKSPAKVDTSALYVPDLAPTRPLSLPPDLAATLARSGTGTLIPKIQLDPWEQAQKAADKEQWPEALKWLAEAERRHPLRPEIHYLHGIVELQRKDLDKALISLRRTIYCDNNFVLAHLVIGDIYETQGAIKKATYQWHQAQTILQQLPADEVIAFGDDLRAEELLKLLAYRLDRLSVQSKEGSNVAS